MNATSTLRAARGPQIRYPIGELARAVQQARQIIDRLERLADDPDAPVDPDTPDDALCALTWGTFARELVFLDVTLAHAASCLECDFTTTVARALRRRA